MTAKKNGANKMRTIIPIKIDIIVQTKAIKNAGIPKIIPNKIRNIHVIFINILIFSPILLWHIQ